VVRSCFGSGISGGIVLFAFFEFRFQIRSIPDVIFLE